MRVEGWQITVGVEGSGRAIAAGDCNQGVADLIREHKLVPRNGQRGLLHIFFTITSTSLLCSNFRDFLYTFASQILVGAFYAVDAIAHFH